MILELKNVEKSYGKKCALKNFSIVLNEGVYGLLGPNGAGKSTLMNLITDNIKRDSGEILFDDVDILKLDTSFRSKLGYMPQQQGMYDAMTCLDFLFYMASLKGISRKEAKNEITKMLEVVGLTDVAYKKLGSFSGGMRQRALLAQALMGDSKVIILDEPTAGLDPKERVKMREFIKEISNDKIVIIATHVVSDVESIAKSIILMNNGEIIKQGATEELIKYVNSINEQSNDMKSTNLEDVYMYFFENK